MAFLTDIVILLFVIVATLALGARNLLDWNSEREQNIRTVSYLQGYKTKERQQDEYDEGWVDAKEKYMKPSKKEDRDDQSWA